MKTKHDQDTQDKLLNALTAPVGGL